MTQLQKLSYPSGNSKTGRIAVSTTARPPCPPTCGMRDACYAEAGYYTRLHWDKVTSGERGVDWDSFLSDLSKPPRGVYFRHNIAGDLWASARGASALRSSASWLIPPVIWELADLLTPQAGCFAPSRFKRSNALGFTINISCEDRAAAAALAKRGNAVTCVVPADADPNGKTDGVRFVQCPATRAGSMCNAPTAVVLTASRSALWRSVICDHLPCSRRQIRSASANLFLNWSNFHQNLASFLTLTNYIHDHLSSPGPSGHSQTGHAPQAFVLG